MSAPILEFDDGTGRPVSGEDLKRGPAVLELDDGSIVYMPDLTLEEALAFVKLARELGERIGGILDPRRVRRVGFEFDRQDKAAAKPEEVQA